ncbi:CoA pyrophosphatase [Barrientosiimonas marina]|uniref:NUDIX hydrolase n=1 Tax=Lentibacillus kimchii TaxID=1542911 RepID=A0ABW2UV37_9BACI
MDLAYIRQSVKQHTPSVLGHDQMVKSAVLLPLIEKEGELHVLFEVRAETMRRQPGEVCFPGGRIDAGDKDAREAAIRETTEELGISSQAISGVFPLDYLVTPFGMLISTYVGLISPREPLQPNASEVGDWFTVPLAFFLETEPTIHHVHLQVKPDDSFPFDLIPGGEQYNWAAGKMDEYFYRYDDRIIWGLTAKILSHFVTIIQ